MKKIFAILVVALALCATAFAAPARDEAWASFHQIRQGVMNSIVPGYTTTVADNCVITQIPATATTPAKWYKTTYTLPESYIDVKDNDNENVPYIGVLEIQRTGYEYPARLTSDLALKQDHVYKITNIKYKQYYTCDEAGAWKLYRTAITQNYEGNKWEDVTFTGTVQDYFNLKK